MTMRWGVRLGLAVIAALTVGCGAVTGTAVAVPLGAEGPAAPASPAPSAAPASPAPSPPSSAPLPAVGAYEGPLVISTGGTYTGNWESLDADVPAITVSTTEPVVIEGANIRSKGTLIRHGVGGIDLTVRNTRGQALNPDRAGRVMGRFVQLVGARRAIIEHNELIGTAGIRLQGYTGDGSGATYRVLGNRARNIDGRMSDGNGGFYGSDQWCHVYDGSCQGVDHVQFTQLVEVRDVPGVEIAYNEIVNEPGHSRVEDVISVYNSSGTAGSPIRIVGNYIQGAYPNSAATHDYSGGGIMLGDGRGGVANVAAEGNHVLDTTNYGMAISSGRQLSMRGNRILSTGRLDDGTPIVAQNVGLYVWASDRSGAVLPGTSVVDNLVGWERPLSSRNDLWMPSVAEQSGNRSYPGAVTPAVVSAEYGVWAGEMAAAGVTVGP